MSYFLHSIYFYFNIKIYSVFSDKIVTGSHSGVLRIFKPQPVKQEDGTYSSFTANDLLLEAQLKSPVIYLGIGVLAS